MKTIRLLLADDHTLVRAGIRKLPESLPNVEVVGEADEGLAYVGKDHCVTELVPLIEGLIDVKVRRDIPESPAS